ncbi:MAG: DUF3368 domain-containing protein [Bacteroidales bacterium]|nr:DUF3368 domain-containing protein [Bacteroidales bacterium]
MDKVIISDASCLIALSKIEELGLLKTLFEEVIITREVSEEFGEALPDWIVTREVKDQKKIQELEKILDKGEASSIALALETDRSMLIIDELKGRKIAQSLHVEIIGTIGVILLAEQKGLTKDVVGTILRLVNQGFRLSEQMITFIIEKYRNK